MYACQSVCPSPYMSEWLYVCVCIMCMIWALVSVSLCVSVCVHVCFRLCSVCIPVSVSVSIFSLWVSLSLCVSVCVYLSLCVFVFWFFAYIYVSVFFTRFLGCALLSFNHDLPPSINPYCVKSGRHPVERITSFQILKFGVERVLALQLAQTDSGGQVIALAPIYRIQKHF